MSTKETERALNIALDCSKAAAEKIANGNTHTETALEKTKQLLNLLHDFLAPSGETQQKYNEFLDAMHTIQEGIGESSAQLQHTDSAIIDATTWVETAVGPDHELARRVSTVWRQVQFGVGVTFTTKPVGADIESAAVRDQLTHTSNRTQVAIDAANKAMLKWAASIHSMNDAFNALAEVEVNLGITKERLSEHNAQLQEGDAMIATYRATEQ
jgi:hypothetical protein